MTDDRFKCRSRNRKADVSGEREVAEEKEMRGEEKNGERQGCEKIQNFEKIHGWMDKIGFIWIKYGDFFKNGFFQKYPTNL